MVRRMEGRVRVPEEIERRFPDVAGRLHRVREHLPASAHQAVGGLPTDAFLWATLGSIGGSLLLRLSGRIEDANFVGMWAPTFLMLGVLNRLEQLEGKVS